MLKLNKKPNPLDLIPDLIQVLDSCLKTDYMIAGGFVRDWYQDEAFNDVDIYVFDRDGDSIKKLLPRAFEIVRSNSRFVEAFFCEGRGIFTKGKPKYRVQFILWHSKPKDVLDSYDFEHCKFFIPICVESPWNTRSSGLFKEFESGTPYAYNKAAESLREKKLVFSSHAITQLGGLSTDDRHLTLLEKYVKRTRKFVERGYTAPSEVKSILVETADRIFSDSWLKRVRGSSLANRADRKSLLLEDVDYEAHLDSDRSSFSIQEIAANVVKELIALHQPNERAIFLISPSPFIRQIAKELMEQSA